MMGPTATRVSIAIAALGCAMVAAVSCAAPHENPTEPDGALSNPERPIRQMPPTTALESASSAQAAAPPPTPFAICGDPPADPTLGTTTFVDLNNDGQPEAISPARLVAGIGDLVEYDVLLRDGDCLWNPIGSVREGSMRSPEDHNVVDHFWTCTHGNRTDTGDYATRLVEVSTSSEPGSQVTVRQLALHESTLERRQTAVVEADQLILRPAAEACQTNRLVGEATVAVDHCEGDGFSLAPPDGWRTTAAGSESCAWFTTEPSTLPCQCDAFPAISVSSGPHREAPEAPTTAETRIDGYRALVTEQLDLEGMGGTTYNYRSYVVQSEQSTIAIAANSQDWPGTWEELTDELDRFAQAIQIVDRVETANASAVPDLARLDSQPVYTDPAGVFAWYRTNARVERPSCDELAPLELAVVDIAQSDRNNLSVRATPAFAAATVVRVHIDGDGSGVLEGVCQDGGSGPITIHQRVEFEPDGSITRVHPPTPEVIVAPVDWFAETSDGLHRYAGGDDPLGRLDHGCTVGSNLNPRRAQTLLRYEGTTITPAFRDVARTGNVQKIHITETNFVLWESHSCQSSGLFLGRIDDEGYIVDRHLVAGRAINPLSWTVTEGDELLIFEPEDWSAPTPSIRRVNLAQSPGWTVTADPAFNIGEPIARSIDDDGNWYLGVRTTTASAQQTCASPTILRDHPDGLRRVSDYQREITGEIVDVMVSPVVDDWRLVVVLAACPDEYEGLAVWFTEERRDSAHQSDWLVFAQADLAPVADVLDARISHDPFTRYATVVMLDGTTTEVTLTRPPPG